FIHRFLKITFIFIIKDFYFHLDHQNQFKLFFPQKLWKKEKAFSLSFYNYVNYFSFYNYRFYYFFIVCISFNILFFKSFFFNYFITIVYIYFYCSTNFTIYLDGYFFFFFN